MQSLRVLASRYVGVNCGARLWQEANESGSSIATFGQSLLVTTTRSLSLAVSPQTPSTSASTPRSCLWLMHLARTPHPARLLPHTTLRHYKGGPAGPAAPGSSSGGKAASTPAKPKKYRTSMSKLYCCRNDRLRHTHEQIWPTMKLTDLELAMFKRNSRLFVVNMGRSISLQAKFRMGQMTTQPPAASAAGAAAAGGAGSDLVPSAVSRKVPYQQARSMLYEQQMHLDAMGENPRYLKVRQVRSLFGTQLQNLRKLRLLLGFQRRRFIQNMYETTLLSPGSHRMWKMVTAMEANPAMFVTRMGLADDILGGVRAVQYDKVYINGRVSDMPYRRFMLPGDVVSPSAGSVSFFRNRIAKSLQPLAGEVVQGIM